MGCTSSRLLMKTGAATKVSPATAGEKSKIAAGENNTQKMASNPSNTVKTTVSSTNTEVITTDQLIFEAADAIFGKPAVHSMEEAASQSIETPDPTSPLEMTAAAAISKFKCYDATDSLQLDDELQLHTPPKTIQPREPNAPSLVRITSYSSFSSGGTNKVTTMSPSDITIRKMPTPIVLSKKLSRDAASNEGCCSANIIISIYRTIVAAFVTTVTTAGSILLSCISKHTNLHEIPSISLQSKPAISTSIICAVLAVLIHSITIYNEFVYDDRAAILENPDVLATRPLWNVFTHDFWGQNMTWDTSHKSYRPLAVLSFRLTKLLHGVDSNAAMWFHLENVILHGVVSFVYCRMCFEIVGRCARNGRVGVLGAVLASILFAVHPIHTEPVASIVGTC